ncbi:MAG: hypothetical protein EPO25_01370 [Gammaproteobacteria bacterium]|nr:MAG: hypothetical protein EPO25_01370 [Gammaproteobacteria bacterium]
MRWGVVGSGATRVGGAVIAFAVQLGIARALGPSHFGVYSYLVAWIVTLSAISTLGMDSAAVRLVARYSVQPDGNSARAFVWYALRSVFIAGLVAGALLYFVVPVASGFIALPSDRTLLLIAAFAVPGVALLNVLCSAIQGAGWPIIGQTPLLVIRPVFLGTTFFVLAAAMWRVSGPLLAITAEGLSIILGVAFASMLALWLLPRANQQSSAADDPRRLWQMIAGLFAVGVLQIVLTQSAVLILGWNAAPDEAGRYAAAARITTVISIALGSINALAAPRIAQLHAIDAQGDLARLARWVAQASFGIGLPIAVLLLLFGRRILDLLGHGFGESYWVLCILTLGQIVNAGAGCVLQIMMMTGHQSVAVRTLGVVAVANVLALVLFVPASGAMAAAWVSACTVITWNVVLVRWIRRNLGLDPSILPMRPVR